MTETEPRRCVVANRLLAAFVGAPLLVAQLLAGQLLATSLLVVSLLAGPFLPVTAQAEVGVDEIRSDVERQRTKRERFPTADGYDVRIAPPPPPSASPQVPLEGPPEAGDSKSGTPKVGSSAPGTAKPGVAAAPIKPPSDFDDPPPPGRHTLQVGAYRSLGNARALKENLSRNFEDVYLNEVSSGGLPLFRVRVGRFSTDEERDEVRRRLRLAGHPSFDVNDAFADPLSSATAP